MTTLVVHWNQLPCGNLFAVTKECSPNPCLNGATCNDSSEGTSCVCTLRHAGTYCQTGRLCQSQSKLNYLALRPHDTANLFNFHRAVVVAAVVVVAVVVAVGVAVAIVGVAAVVVEVVAAAGVVVVVVVAIVVLVVVVV